MRDARAVLAAAAPYRATREKNFEGKPVVSEKTMAVMNESQAHGLIAYWNQLGKRTGDVYELLNLTHYSGSTKHIQWTNSGTGHCYMHIPGSEKIVAQPIKQKKPATFLL